MTPRLRGKWFEIAWPWLLAATAAIAVYFMRAQLSLPRDSETRVLDKLIDFCSIGVGFWATALALLLALDGRDTVAGLKTLEVYNRIVGYFLTTVYSFFAQLVLCLYTIAAGRPSWIPHPLFVSIWAFLVTFTAASMLRAFRLLGKLLRSR